MLAELFISLFLAPPLGENSHADIANFRVFVSIGWPGTRGVLE